MKKLIGVGSLILVALAAAVFVFGISGRDRSSVSPAFAQATTPLATSSCTSWSQTTTNSPPPSLCLGDLDGSGNLVIVAGYYNASGYRVAIVNPNGTIRASVTLP